MIKFIINQFNEKIQKKLMEAGFHKKIFMRVITIFVPFSILLILGIFIFSRNSNRISYSAQITLPSALGYIQLERSVMNMQKWITYICATRAEKGYDDGAQKAAMFYYQSKSDLNHLKDILKNNPEEQKKLKELESSVSEYYELGIEVAKAYVEQGTFYGNAMLDVFSIIENKLNTSLRKLTKGYTDETIQINQSVQILLNGAKIILSVMIFFFIGLCYTGYLFLVKREELGESNAKLVKAMEELWGEMELAKKIQHVLLPKKPMIKGFDISAHLKPANEVGGDYYDIINVEGIDWIIIGDVSGHGVTAGLVMMMAQTAIHTVLSNSPDLSPSQLLTIVNKTITKNIRNLGESKYMTIMVLAAMKDGYCTFSGLHRDILIYRNNDKKVEYIPTRGMWIGLEHDISNMLFLDNLHVGINDVVVLHTDGITEAMNHEEEMFGEVRLENVITDMGNQPVEMIKDSILSALEPYKQDDDVTLVVLRRLI